MTKPATIYTAYHAAAPLLKSASVAPIHVGRAIAKAPLGGMTGDDTHDNISNRNRTYCELTGLYWAWKNDTGSDAIGLMHYRRVLDFVDAYPSDRVEVRLSRFDIPDWQDKTEAWLTQEGGNFDIVLPRVHSMGVTVAENYARAHHISDFNLTRDIIARDHAAYLGSFDKVAAGNSVRLGNIALMKRDIFERYCAWMFDILAKVEAADLDRSRYSPRQYRYLGYLSERLFTVFVKHEQDTNPGLKLREVSILNLAEATVTPYVADERFNGHDHINIAIAADETYAPHAGAMLQSLIDHVDHGRQLNIFFLHTDVPAETMDLLKEVISTHPRSSLHAINTGDAFADSYRSASRAPSNATYNRFLMFALFPGLDRLLYLDCDMIVRHDISELFDTDMGDALIGAVPDWIMTRTLTDTIRTADPKVPDLYKYQRDKLKMDDAQIERYFNAGVLLFNFKKFASMAQAGDDLMAEVKSGGYLFRDQDILNSYFRNDLKLLDLRWNVFNSNTESYDKVPRENHAKAMAARTDPWIIHYADRFYKPWLGSSVSWSQYYWNAVSRTPFYGEVLANLSEATTKARSKRAVTRAVDAGKAVAEKYPALRQPMLRIYAGLRRLRGR